MWNPEGQSRQAGALQKRTPDLSIVLDYARCTLSDHPTVLRSHFPDS